MIKNCMQCEYCKIEEIGKTKRKTIISTKCKYTSTQYPTHYVNPDSSEIVVHPSHTSIPHNCPDLSKRHITPTKQVDIKVGDKKVKFDIGNHNGLTSFIGKYYLKGEVDHPKNDRQDPPLELDTFNSNALINVPPLPTHHLFKPKYFKDTTQLNLTDTIVNRTPIDLSRRKIELKIG